MTNTLEISMPETKTLDLSQFESPKRDTPNVKKLWSPEIEKEQDELFFDPERDITKEDWKWIDKKLEEHLDSNELRDCDSFVTILASMKILNPEKCSDIIRTNKEKIWQKMNQRLVKHREEIDKLMFYEGYKNFAQFAKKIKMVFPERKIEFKKEDWKKLDKGVKYFFIEHGKMFVGSIGEMLEPIKIINPKRITLTERQKDNINSDLDVFRKKASLFKLILMLARTRIIDDSFDVKLNQSQWQKAKQLLEYYINENEQESCENFTELALAMTILAAEKIEITDHGLKIILPKRKPKISKTPPLPKRLEF